MLMKKQIVGITITCNYKTNTKSGGDVIVQIFAINITNVDIPITREIIPDKLRWLVMIIQS